jgi:hypothetical protein
MDRSSRMRSIACVDDRMVTASSIEAASNSSASGAAPRTALPSLAKQHGP